MGSKDDTKLSKPSSNWLALQKNLPASTKSTRSHANTKRKLDHAGVSSRHFEHPTAAFEDADFIRGPQPSHLVACSSSSATFDGPSHKNGESKTSLRKMIAGELEYSEAQQETGKYLAIDCEMVGVGIDGKESSLARVSMVNYYGAIIMDEFVRQRERVVDYRTEFSGIRPSDMVKAKPFAEVQQRVAELMKDRTLVGHAIHNDLKVLLLSHPRHLIRDTQFLAGKHKVMKTRRPALRLLTKQELGVVIQEGEHSSVTDARATMAVYRIHRRQWDKGVPPAPGVPTSSKKRRISSDEVDDDGLDESYTVTDGKGKVPSAGKSARTFPGGGRKGVSSGLSTIIKRRDDPGKAYKKKSDWWKEPVGGGSSGVKGSMSLKAG